VTASNHVVTGALIAANIRNPAMALPLALVSHFVLDALPHFGKVSHTTKKYMVILCSDMVVASSFLGYLLLTRPNYWLLMMACGIIAAAPDLMWFPRFWKEIHGKVSHKPVDKITQFHSKIQWGERPWGIIIELLWFFGIVFLLSSHI